RRRLGVDGRSTCVGRRTRPRHLRIHRHVLGHPFDDSVLPLRRPAVPRGQSAAGDLLSRIDHRLRLLRRHIHIGRDTVATMKGALMYTVSSYIIYLIVSVILTIWVAHTLRRRGRVFLI